MIQKKLNELEALITVPNVDKYPEQSLTAMKALSLIVDLRGLVKDLDLHIVRCCPNCRCDEDFMDEDEDGILFCNRCDALL